MSAFQSRWVAPALCLLATITVAPARAAPLADARLAGQWQLDEQASDSFDDKLAKLAETLRAKRKARRGGMRGGFGGPPEGAGSDGGPDGSDAGLDANGVPRLPSELPPESRDEIRDRLGETYRPATHLRIELNDGDVRMLGDAPPERRYNLEETVTRMDLSGTATLRTSWTGGGLQVDSRYTNRSRSTQRFVVDRTGAMLTVTLELSEPVTGKLQLHSVYRRQGAN